MLKGTDSDYVLNVCGTTAVSNEAHRGNSDMDHLAARVAMNQARFREANEEIEPRAMVAGVEMVPFICECAEPNCTKIIRVTTREYETVRADPVLFLNAPGHEVHSGEYAEVVSRNERFVVTRKIGDAAPIVKSLDPREEDDADAA